MKKGMKRISLFLAAIMLMSLCIGCAQKASDPPSTSEENADMIAPDWKGATLTLGTLNPEAMPIALLHSGLLISSPKRPAAG